MVHPTIAPGNVPGARHPTSTTEARLRDAERGPADAGGMDLGMLSTDDDFGLLKRYCTCLARSHSVCSSSYIAKCRRLLVPRVSRPSTMRNDRVYTLLFDGDCRICRAFACVVHLLDVRRAVAIGAIQASGELLRTVPPDERLSAAHMVAPDGRVTSGGDAMPAIVAALVADSGVERRIRRSRRSMAALDRLYRIMVGVRGQLTCAAGPVSAARSPR